MDPSDIQKLQRATLRCRKVGASVGSRPSQPTEASKMGSSESSKIPDKIAEVQVQPIL